MYNNLKKYFPGLVFLIKILIVAGAYYVISDKLLHSGNLNGHLWMDRLNDFGPDSFSFILLLILLSLINWWLEILKWKTLVSSVSNISILQASKQSLASLTASLLTPNRIGEYGAKAIYYSKDYRPKILFLNFLANTSQLLMTILFGLAGLLILGNLFPIPAPTLKVIPSALGVLIISVFILVVFQKIWFPYFRKIKLSFKRISYQIKKEAFVFASLRYLVFSHQFYVFLLFFEVDLHYNIAMPLIFSMYLISSLIPGFVLFDWLVKGSVAVTLFTVFGVNDILILSVTASMWILNFAIPAVIGSYYVLTFDSKKMIVSESTIRQ